MGRLQSNASFTVSPELPARGPATSMKSPRLATSLLRQPCRQKTKSNATHDSGRNRSPSLAMANRTRGIGNIDPSRLRGQSAQRDPTDTTYLAGPQPM
ncbi:hypothetical protein EYF80_010239 [Liparis tanakae]|uniref:Uncharacterized protein n=1 Tax=Liparis tanakae TaxID=230148 RepID=A0A4Z2INH9_9TELE|nr:hypothetical protein EYF80_010239 [Liparis tanakae]